MPTNQEMYDAIIALLHGRASTDQMSYRIGTRELYRLPIPDLQSLARAYYTRLKAERALAAGESVFSTISTE